MELSSFLPYPCTLQANGVDIQFTTINGVIYEVTYLAADEYFPGYQFSADAVLFNIFPTNEPAAPLGLDARIGLTIIDIIAGRFKQNPQTILCYVCDQADARAFKRAMRFARLFEQGNDEQQLEKADIEQPPLYASILFRRKHPQQADIKIAVRELADKFLEE